MEIKFNVTKEERKALVAAVSELTGWSSVYKGAPTFAFAVNNYIIDRNGAIIYDERTSAEEVRNLLTGLAERGFVFEGGIDEIAPAASEQAEAASSDFVSGDAESDEDANGENERTRRNTDPFTEYSMAETPDKLVLEVPLDGFSHTALNNLEKMVAGKCELIMKAIGLSPSNGWDDLPIEQTETTLRFPWFPLPASKDEIDAYSKFVCALCDLAKKQKRVTMKENSADSDSSEKFAFRCFLLRLGFIGKDYGSARKVLLSKLSGNGSFKTGDHKRGSAPEDGGRLPAATAADSGTDNPEAITVRDSGNNANSAAGAPTLRRCGECQHHCYYTDGLLRTRVGDIVDTSKRAPDKYTHYCLGAPSGYRKIKNAADWSGSETAPTWCPLHSESNNGIAVREDENDANIVATGINDLAEALADAELIYNINRSFETGGNYAE